MSAGEPRRRALVLACAQFADNSLPPLRSPRRDAEVLGATLADHAASRYDVDARVDVTAHEARLSIEDFFATARPNDQHLLYISTHGVQDQRGELYFALRDTQKDRPAATAVSAEWVNEQIRVSRSRATIVLVDCCFSGAFIRGMRARDSGEASLGLLVRDMPPGTGVAVLTASGETEFSLEEAGGRAAAAARPSYFTEAVVAGISSGAADRDGDGRITVDELYDYVYRRVVDGPSPQRPRRMGLGEGEMVVAEVAVRIDEPPLPAPPVPVDATVLITPEDPLTPWPPVPDSAIRYRTGPPKVPAPPIPPDVSAAARDRGRRGRAVAAVAAAAALITGAGTVYALSRPPDKANRQTPPPTVSWHQIGNLTAPLDSPGVATLAGELWVVGGLLPRVGTDAIGKATDKVQIYNPAQAQWRTGPPLPHPIDHAGVASDGRRIWVLGGQTDSGKRKISQTSVYFLDANTSTWRKGPPLPAPRQAGAAAWDGGRLVFGGGIGGHSRVHDDVWALHADEWRWIGRLQQPRQHLGAASDGNGRVWFVGGHNGKEAVGLTDIAKGATVTPGDGMKAFSSPAAIWDANGGVCTLGGFEGKRPIATVACQRGRNSFPQLTDERGGAGAAILDQAVYFVGGIDAKGLSSRVDVLTR